MLLLGPSMVPPKAIMFGFVRQLQFQMDQAFNSFMQTKENTYYLPIEDLI